MASIRLIAQYPNVGNSGHIFLIPTGQKENSLGVGEKINTEMLSIRHAKSVSSDYNTSEIIDSSLIQGKHFLAVSIPINQVLKEKSSIRVSHVWMAIEGFNVASNETIFPKLYLELQLLIPKLEAVVLKLGHLEPNVSRYIEVVEMVEWSQNPVFLSVNDLCEPTQPTSSVEVLSREKTIAKKPSICVVATARKYIAGIVVSVIAVSFSILFISNLFSGCKVDQPLKHQPNNEPNKPDVAHDFIYKLESFCGKTDDDKIDQAVKFFGISRKDLEKIGLEKNWKQEIDDIKKFIHSSATKKIVSIVDKEDGIGLINLISDVDIKKMRSEHRISDNKLTKAKELTKEINIFIKNLLIIKNNKVVLGLIKEKGWLIPDKFIVDFVKDSTIPILNDGSGRCSQAFFTYDDILSKSDGLSDDFDMFFNSAILIGMNVEYWHWETYNQLNKKIKDCIKDIKLALNPKP